MSSSRDLLLTLFGEHLAAVPRPVWVGTLVRLLGLHGVSEGTVRTTLSRMSADGWVASTRRGRNSFYRLTPEGREEAEARGERRTYRDSWTEPWDGRWTLLHYSITGDRAEVRSRLRKRLRRLGFGPAGGGLWLSPHRAAERLEELASQFGLEERLRVFRGEHVGPAESEVLLERCWDLPDLNRDYEAFIDRRLGQYRRCRRKLEEGTLEAETAFVLHLELLQEFADFPLADPVLPPSLQPETWAGECAEVLYESLRDLLAGPAGSYVDEVLAEERRAVGGPAAGSTA